MNPTARRSCFSGTGAQRSRPGEALHAPLALGRWSDAILAALVLSALFVAVKALPGVLIAGPQAVAPIEISGVATSPQVAGVPPAGGAVAGGTRLTHLQNAGLATMTPIASWANVPQSPTTRPATAWGYAR